MRDEMNLSSVDLIYLDPPFSSNRDYNAVYKDETGRMLPDQVEAFCDTGELNSERIRAIQEMNALRRTQPRLLAYLSYIAQRLLPMRGILRPTGSVYLHCDPTASHYIKVLMDAIFEHANFRNEIIWKRTGSHGGARRWWAGS